MEHAPGRVCTRKGIKLSFLGKTLRIALIFWKDEETKFSLWCVKEMERDMDLFKPVADKLFVFQTDEAELGNSESHQLQSKQTELHQWFPGLSNSSIFRPFFQVVHVYIG